MASTDSGSHKSAAERMEQPDMIYQPQRTDRAYTSIRKYGWFLTVLIALAGQFFPFLGLFVPFIMAIMIGLSLSKGLYFCGNFCPHGSYYDVPLFKFSRLKSIPYFFKNKILVTAIFLFFLINVSLQLNSAIQSREAAFVNSVGSVFARVYLVVFMVATVLGLLINSRTWCYFCPMRTLQIMGYRIGKKLGLTEGKDELITIKNKEKCVECGKCSRVCPIQLKPYPILKYKVQGDQLKDEHCMRCLVCVKNCPVEVLELAEER